MYISLIRTYFFNYAAPLSCDNNPQNVMALDLDNAEHFVVT